jgi:hypothetical protein
MATPGRTQKQIAERYKGNLGYYKRKHPWRVARFTASFLALAGGVAAIIAYQNRIFQRKASEEFFSSGRISSHHAKYEQDCAQCHDKNAAMGNDLTLAKFKNVLKDRFHHGVDFKSIDHRCEECHEKNPPFGTKKEYDLHEPNVVENRACSICHQEHLGPGPMKKVADSQCASCHADQSVMTASAEYGKKIPEDRFHLRVHPPEQIVFERPRPPNGYTQVFSSFDRPATQGGHPEFQLIREKASDPDTLRFNHARHFSTEVSLKGQKLTCNFCHQPEPGGQFYQRVSFAANCQTCHALLFDTNNPQLHVPHGEVKLVRTFLRTLKAQYALLPHPGDTKTFVAEQMSRLRRDFRSDSEVERAIFFETNPYKPDWPRERPEPAMTRAKFNGCAVCHEVKMQGREISVTPPCLVDRWMPQANFNHAKHTSVSCEECHTQARQSKETSQVLMPDKAKCISCHSPEKKIASSGCITCHTYHAPGQVVKTEVQADTRRPFKELLLGSNAR